MAFQGDSIFWVEVEKVVPNPFQPRREFDEAKLRELSESVRMYGILQPLTVTRREVQNEDGSFRSEYELIAGERRLRASKLAGLLQVPVIIREGEQSEQEKLELAIIENLQREDLNAVDRAMAFRQLADVFGLSHTQVAHKVGRSREYVSNTIRLLALPDYMLNSLRLGDMSEGHARTLLMLNDRPEEQDTVFREILLKKLSVREVERIARGIASEKIRVKGDFDADLLALEKKFTETLGTRVSIIKTEFGGRVSIDYFTAEDLESMLARMKIDQPPVTATTPVAPEPDSLSSFLEPRELANPRADELAILTDSTGLELAPVVDSINSGIEDTVSPAEVTPEPISPPSNAINWTKPSVLYPNAHLPVQPATDLPEIELPSLEMDVPVGDFEESFESEPVFETTSNPVIETVVTELVDEPIAEVSIVEMVDEVAPESEPEVAVTTSEEPAESPVVAVETPTSTTPPRSSFREQLAALLGQVPKPVADTPAVAPVATPVPVPVPVQNTPVALPTTATVAATPVVAAVAITPALASSESDDSHLYDLKNFSI